MTAPTPPTPAGEVELRIDDVKRKLWSGMVAACLCEGPLPNEELEALVGRLGFAAYAVYGRWANSRLPALYAAVGHLTPEVLLNEDSRQDLKWWQEQLESDVCSCVPMSLVVTRPILSYTDAEGTGGIGAVLLDSALSEGAMDQSVWWRGLIPESARATLRARKTQINAYELVTVCLALRWWAPPPPAEEGHRVYR